MLHSSIFKLAHFIRRYIYIYIYKPYDVLLVDFVFIYFDAYIFISTDFMFKVQTHVQQFENICKPQKTICFILIMMMP
jgi:hypothetical protein